MIKIRRNCKKIEKRKLGIKISSKARKKLWLRKFHNQKRVAAKIAFRCEKISQPSGAAVKIPLPAAKIDLRCETISQLPYTRCESPSWHTSAISQPGTTVSQLRIGCDFSHAWRPAFSQPKHYLEGCFAATKPPFGTRAPVRKAVRSFRSCKMGCEIDTEFSLTAKTPSCCEIRASSLRKNPSAAKRNSDPLCSF